MVGGCQNERKETLNGEVSGVMSTRKCTYRAVCFAIANTGLGPRGSVADPGGWLAIGLYLAQSLPMSALQPPPRPLWLTE